MPSGSTHRTATMALLPAASLAAGYTASKLGWQAGMADGLRAGLACGLGVLATLAVNPDLDLLESSIKSKVRNKTNLLPWWIVWYPYAVAIPHRHPLSHAPILSTLVRIIYLSSILAVAVAGLSAANMVSDTSLLWLAPPWLIRWAILGMIASDSLHWLMDQLF